MLKQMMVSLGVLIALNQGESWAADPDNVLVEAGDVPASNQSVRHEMDEKDAGDAQDGGVDYKVILAETQNTKLVVKSDNKIYRLHGGKQEQISWAPESVNGFGTGRFTNGKSFMEATPEAIRADDFTNVLGFYRNHVILQGKTYFWVGILAEVSGSVCNPDIEEHMSIYTLDSEANIAFLKQLPTIKQELNVNRRPCNEPGNQQKAQMLKDLGYLLVVDKSHRSRIYDIRTGSLTVEEFYDWYTLRASRLLTGDPYSVIVRHQNGNYSSFTLIPELPDGRMDLKNITNTKTLSINDHKYELDNGQFLVEKATSRLNARLFDHNPSAEEVADMEEAPVS